VHGVRDREVHDSLGVVRVRGVLLHGEHEHWNHWPD
jgi:hypothetical protein